MNIYTQHFTAECVNNGRTVAYTLTIESRTTIMVEDIQAEVGKLKRGYHEQFADQLFAADSCNVARNVGIDDNWGKYAPASRAMRALIMMDRIEAHASARRWCHKSSGVQQNMELVG